MARGTRFTSFSRCAGSRWPAWRDCPGGRIGRPAAGLARKRRQARWLRDGVTTIPVGRQPRVPAASQDRVAHRRGGGCSGRLNPPARHVAAGGEHPSAETQAGSDSPRHCPGTMNSGPVASAPRGTPGDGLRSPGCGALLNARPDSTCGCSGGAERHLLGRCPPGRADRGVRRHQVGRRRRDLGSAGCPACGIMAMGNCAASRAIPGSRWLTTLSAPRASLVGFVAWNAHRASPRERSKGIGVGSGHDNREPAAVRRRRGRNTGLRLAWSHAHRTPTTGHRGRGRPSPPTSSARSSSVSSPPAESFRRRLTVARCWALVRAAA